MSAPAVIDLLDRADHERAAGREDDAAALYDEAIAVARTSGDLQLWIRACLGAASLHVFGTDPGRLPAQLYDLLVRTTEDADRSRVAAALAHCWTYGGQASRAALFAAEALERAERSADPELVADALDAMLACHWGPDDLELRSRLGTRLDEVAAHVLAPNSRLQAHLWGLQVACETLNIQSLHRHLRALERLGSESPRARFFAASRRLMYDLLCGRTDTAEQLINTADSCSGASGLADAWMVVLAMRGYAAVIAGDRDTCARVAAEAEAFALAEGAAEVCAEAAWLWIGADRLDHAERLVDTLRGRVLEELPRDVNWLLTLQATLEAALAAGSREVVETAARLLGPYEGRAVFNAGAVNFHGLTDDTLARAAEITGDLDRAKALRDRALTGYIRLGARWWYDRLQAWAPGRTPGSAPVTTPATTPATTVHLHPIAGDLWLIGAGDGRPFRGLRGFQYLRMLLSRPGSWIPAVDLAGGGTRTVVQPAVDTVIDGRALAAYRARLAAIEEELAEAEDWSDLARMESLGQERSALLDQVAESTGIGGRLRPTSSTAERARVAVSKAISVALDRIEQRDAELAEHLRSSVHNGAECSYQPGDDHPVWILDEPAV
ncbi:hypothetical protein [Microlunatus sp. Gsoil 973]|uniref:hypothetical protein n=1 Tax=Microlunatus sp. Gsoil 973 TaxID=2672569 RepID=UPI0012B4951D|nr:hypothetical protein [Microlunatus sp. Gsoil 973]QGN34935.1 hypothetical protein GJV80_21295 [Microlunatus sp. Gsoil 973]